MDLLEGLLVKKAGLVDSMGLVDGPLSRSGRRGARNFPESKTITAPRISKVYTKGTLTLARLGREAPIAAASPSGPVLRNVEGGSLDARSLYPETRQTRPESCPGRRSSARARPCSTRRASSGAGPRPMRRRSARRASGPRPPPRVSSPTSSEGPDAAQELLADDPELGSSVLGESTGSEEPATEGGIDPGAGDEADATSDGALPSPRERSRT